MALLLAGSVLVTACSSSTAPVGETPETTSLPAHATRTLDQQEPTAVIPPVSSNGHDDQGLQLLAHRGVHQTYSPEGVQRDTCTATRIHPPAHEYLENTLPSMQAAFAAGAAVVEIDIAVTSDGVVAVFHDWTVECRTDGVGEIRGFSWDELSELDIGYGYTADGETHPFRGQGVGLLPRLEDVFEAFPDGQFLINFKSNDPAEAVVLQEVVERENAGQQVWGVYGGPDAVATDVSKTGARGFSEESVLACLTEYLAAESDTATLEACEDTIVVVPLDLASLLNGWPYEFTETMTSHGTSVVISGSNGSGIDSQAEFDDLPQDLNAYVWTDRVESIS